MTESPHIWTRRPKIIEPRSELILPSMRVAGEYTLRSINRFSGKVVRELGPFSNLITNAGLDAVAGLARVTGLRVGTGNIPPAFSDTALVAQVAASTSLQSSSFAQNQTADKYHRATRTYRFVAPGVSHNIQEVGAFGDNDLMWSRALVVDGSGSPTSFSWGADEILDVTYTLRRYPPLIDLETTMTVNSTTYDVVCRAANADQWGWLSQSDIALGAALAAGDSGNGSQAFSGPIGTIDSVPSGILGNSTSRSDFEYTGGNFYRDGQVIWGTASANGSISSFRIGYMPRNFNLPDFEYQVGIVGGGPLVKTNTQTLALNWRIAWARREI